MPVMVFHAPFELQDNPTAASALRPVRMLKAFENIGYKVWKVTGTGRDRKKSLRALQRALDRGLTVDFVYSESATIPNSFTEPRHFPLRPFLDAEFFALMHRHKIPVGVFYRDIYWAFEDYRERVGLPVALGMTCLYRWDLTVYNRYVDVLFAPSTQMGQYIPGQVSPDIVPLPPGADYRPAPAEAADSGESEFDDSHLHLLYVGGVSPGHYDISLLLKAVSLVAGVSLTLCTPESQWEVEGKIYSDALSDSVTVVHRDANNLDDLYQIADVATLFVRPQEYRTFAAPVKLFEYMGRGKPIIASKGTLAATIVESSKSGWAIEYDTRELVELLTRLRDERVMVAERAKESARAGREHTWEARARLASDTLMGLGKQQ